MRLGPANKQDIEGDSAIQALFSAVKRTLSHPEFSAGYAILVYIYSRPADKLYYLIGEGGELFVGQLMVDEQRPVTGSLLLELHETYQDYFFAGNDQTDQSLHANIGMGVFDCWRRLYELFLQPFTGLNKDGRRKEVFCQFLATVGSTTVYFNLPMLYNLAFRYTHLIANTNLYFTAIVDEGIYDYFTGQLTLPYPTMDRLVLLRGLPKYDGQETRLVLRERLLEMAAKRCAEQGGEYRELRSATDFGLLFSKRNGRNFIQLLTHFGDDFLVAIDGHPVRLESIVAIARDKKANGGLGAHLVLDAMTCNNDKAFLPLKAAGLQRIYYSHQLLNTDLAVYQLYELYSGELALSLDWTFPYLDGTRPLHMAYSDITRAQYITMNLQQTIHLGNTLKNPANMTSIETYLDSLTLAYAPVPYRTFRQKVLGAPAEQLAQDHVEQTFLADRSIVSFLAEVSAANRVDVLNTILLAQAVANDKVPDHDNRMMEWYEAFIEVLTQSTFWAVQAAQVTTFKSNSSVFEMQSAILGILTAAFTGDVVAILEKSITAIGQLADKDGRIKAFDKNAHSAGNGCFQLGAAIEKNGIVSLQLGTFVITTTDTSTNILFIKTAKDQTSMKYVSRQATFNSPGYTPAVRAKVALILEKKAMQYLDAL